MPLYNILLIFVALNLTGYLSIDVQSNQKAPINSLTEVNKNEDKGIGQKNIAVPDLLGMTVKEAKKILQSKSLYIRAIIPLSENGLQNLDKQIVCKQTPSSKNSKGVQNYIRKGQLMDFWVVGEELIIDTLKKPFHKTRVVIRDNSQ